MNKKFLCIVLLGAMSVMKAADGDQKHNTAYTAAKEPDSPRTRKLNEVFHFLSDLEDDERPLTQKQIKVLQKIMVTASGIKRDKCESSGNLSMQAGALGLGFKGHVLIDLMGDKLVGSSQQSPFAFNAATVQTLVKGIQTLAGQMQNSAAQAALQLTPAPSSAAPAAAASSASGIDFRENLGMVGLPDLSDVKPKQQSQGE